MELKYDKIHVIVKEKRIQNPNRNTSVYIKNVIKRKKLTSIDIKIIQNNKNILLIFIYVGNNRYKLQMDFYTTFRLKTYNIRII